LAQTSISGQAGGDGGRETASGKPPNTTLKRSLSGCLPHMLFRFLWSEPNEFCITKFFLGVGFGGFIGLGLYFSVVHKLKMYEENKMKVLYLLEAICGIGWAMSMHFRCSTLLMIPQALGKEGRTLLLVLVLAAIYNGSVSHIRIPFLSISVSLTCSFCLLLIVTSLSLSRKPRNFFFCGSVQASGNELKNETKEMKVSFERITQQVTGKYGYDFKKKKGNPNSTSSTQKEYEKKTKLRCEYVVEKGVGRCRLWFAEKYHNCMRTIAVPLINNLLCIPMTFKFLCELVRVIKNWCKRNIPVDGNFGQTYDRVTDNVDNMDSDFETRVTVKKVDQEMMIGTNISKALITQEINLDMNKKRSMLDAIMNVLQTTLSCTFIFVFVSAFSYTNRYNHDIRYDNIYVTTYFRQIDARRRILKKRTLLPLKRAEKSQFIFPWSPKIQSPEIQNVMKGLVHCIPVTVFLLLSFGIDYIFFMMFDIIRRHSLVGYTFNSKHHLEIIVGGNTMMSRLLQKTIRAFNTKSEMNITSSNQHCLPRPQALTRHDYITAFVPLALMILFCVLQVFVFRLRRVIASFYFPKREKKRTLFLYNEYIRKRVTYMDVQRKKIIKRVKKGKISKYYYSNTLYSHCAWLRSFIRRRCMVCYEPETQMLVVCQTESCGAVYCQQCWKDMKHFCFACMPYQGFVSEDSDSEEDPKYAS
uniref:DC-STAMP domain containing 1 n=1 Tax=Latimeria chalumnae TaxID=7897 RepID=H3B0R6_LATCH